MFDKVLILSASAGAGHLRAAQAMEAAFKQMRAAREVRHEDTLQYTNAMFRRLYSKTYLDMCNQMPTMLGWFYDQLDQPWKNERIRLAFSKLNTGPFVKLLNAYQPDIAVCTHFLPSEIISDLKGKGRIKCPLAIVVTDMDAHAMWLCRYFDRYFVAIEETAVHLEKLGIPADRISVTGIPIDPVFSQPLDRAQTRRQLGLDPGKITILVSTGGFGVGPIDHLMTALLQIRHRVQLVAICGRNTKLQEQLQTLAKSLRPEQPALHVVGYTNQMDHYMAAADLLVGKPGGLTTSEALTKGLIMCIVNPIPGQEERNSDHLLEEGAAIRSNNLPALAYKIDKLLDDPARMSAIRANIRRLARPHAALDIVKILLQSHR